MMKVNQARVGNAEGISGDKLDAYAANNLDDRKVLRDYF
jgi:hypothetical protein